MAEQRTTIIEVPDGRSGETADRATLLLIAPYDLHLTQFSYTPHEPMLVDGSITLSLYTVADPSDLNSVDTTLGTLEVTGDSELDTEQATQVARSAPVQFVGTLVQDTDAVVPEGYGLVWLSSVAGATGEDPGGAVALEIQEDEA